MKMALKCLLIGIAIIIIFIFEFFIVEYSVYSFHVNVLSCLFACMIYLPMLSSPINESDPKASTTVSSLL